MKKIDDNDFELIRRYQKGDEQAFSALFLKYYPMVYKIFLMKQIPQKDAEDFTSEVFIKMIDALKKYRFESPFSHYLRRVVRNRIFDFYRAKKVKCLPLDLPQVLKLRLTQNQESDLDEIIEHCLKLIKSELRRAIIIAWLENYRREQIAKLLHIPIGTVHSNLERGKIQFRTCIRENL
jgi:RNA polymerase sigma factor (sigma-70 family)